MDQTTSPLSVQDFQSAAEPFQHELLVHCYRFLGSLEDAEDALQETMLRAWRRLETLKDRGALRAWLYKIATYICLDLIDSRKARLMPAGVGQPADPRAALPAPVREPIWLEPLPEEYLDLEQLSPEARYEARESVTLAFLTVLQTLPGRQRAVLILRDVLGWSAQETAGLLEISPAAANSALQRARSGLRKNQPEQPLASRTELDEAQTASLLARYVRAWEDADTSGFVRLLREDAVLTMPPLPAWYLGRVAIEEFFAAHLFAGQAAGRYRLLPARANGAHALAVYQQDAGGVYRPAVLQVLTVADGQIGRIDCFMVSVPGFFQKFNLPVSLGAMN